MCGQEHNFVHCFWKAWKSEQCRLTNHKGLWVLALVHQGLVFFDAFGTSLELFRVRISTSHNSSQKYMPSTMRAPILNGMNSPMIPITFTPGTKFKMSKSKSDRMQSTLISVTAPILCLNSRNGGAIKNNNLPIMQSSRILNIPDMVKAVGRQLYCNVRQRCHEQHLSLTLSCSTGTCRAVVHICSYDVFNLKQEQDHIHDCSCAYRTCYNHETLHMLVKPTCQTRMHHSPPAMKSQNQAKCISHHHSLNFYGSIFRIIKPIK